MCKALLDYQGADSRNIWNCVCCVSILEMRF